MSLEILPLPESCRRRMLAAVDIGTLTCRLLIAEIDLEGRLHERYSERGILRLGTGVDRHKRLDPSAMARVIDTLKAWRALIDQYSVERAVAVATSAVRDADNRQEFLTRVRQETGFDVEILSGDEEAHRTMLGIRSGLPPGTRGVLGVDIGGGSTEFILDRPGASPIVRSFDIGVVRLTERCFCHDPPTTAEVEQARNFVRRCTAEMLPLLSSDEPTRCVGTAGTITTLAAIAQGMSVYEPARIHHYVLRLDTVRRLETDIVGRTTAARRQLPGVEQGREEVIAAGVVILRTTLEALSVDECLVSDLGLREGVLLELATRDDGHGRRAERRHSP